MRARTLNIICSGLLTIFVTCGCGAALSAAGDGSAQQSDALPSGIHLGHSVDVLAVSPDGKIFATGGRDRTIRLWDAATGREFRILQGHTKGIEALAFGPDSKKLFSVGHDDAAISWDVTTGKALSKKQFGLYEIAANNLAVTSDGKTVAVGEDGDVRFLDAASLEEVSKIRTAPGRTFMALSPDGKTVAAGNEEIRIFDVATSKELRKLDYKGGIRGLAFTPDGKTIIAASPDDSTAKAWSADSGKLLRTFALPKPKDDEVSISFGSFDVMSLTSDGKLLATAGGDGIVRIWDVASGKQIKSIESKGAVALLAFNTPGNQLMALAGIPLSVGTGSLVVWDVNTWKPVRTIDQHYTGVLNAALSSDGKVLATVAPISGTLVKLWDLQTGKNFATTSGDPITEQWDLTFSPDGKIVAATYGSDVKLIDAATGKELRKIEFAHGDRAVQAVAFSPDGKVLATGGANPKPFTGRPNRTVRIWDVATGKRLQELQPGHEDPVVALAFSPDGKTIASGGGHELKLWDIASGKAAHSLENDRDITFLSFSPDGTMLVTADMKGSIKLWDPKSGKELRAMSIDGNTFTGAFSPDGKTLATGGATVKLWNTADGSELRTLSGHTGYVRFVSFTPNGSKLISAAEDGTIRIWEAQSGNQLVALYPVDKNDWIAVKPDGKFETTPNAAKYLDDTFKKEDQQTAILSNTLGVTKEASKTASE